jgi:hypothetical protein
MPSTDLHARLQNLAHAFADEVFEAIRSASLHELTAGDRVGNGRPARAEGGGGSTSSGRSAKVAKTKNGRLARRSAEEIEKALGLVVAALKAGPLRAEELKKKLGLDTRELPRVLAEGLSSKKLKKKGQKRATTYSAA